MTASTLALAVPAYAGRLEAGNYVSQSTLNGGNAATRVNFQQTFDQPPVVVVLSNSQGNQSAAIRITNVTTTGFDSLIIEPDNWDGRHVAQQVQYVAVEPGRHVLSDGTIIEAGRTNTNQVQADPVIAGPRGFTNVSFDGPLSTTASVISQLQTANSETRNVPAQTSRPWITALTVNPSATGFQLALERSEANSGTVQTETVGWIAFPQGSSTFPDVNGNTITWGASNPATAIRGWDDGCFSVPLPINSPNIVAVAKKRTRNNSDGGWFRYCNLNNGTISLRVDEDTDIDNGRGLSNAQAENAAVLAFSQPFHANLRPEIQVTKTSFTVALPGDTGFSTPGATKEYLVTIQNVGNAPPNPDTVIITDSLDPNTSLILADINGAGSGPVRYTPVNGAGGLTYSFGGLGAAGDDLGFSNDGSTFGYTPTPGARDEDSAVQAIQISPTGLLSGDTGSGPGEITLRYRVLID
ncbi:H-type lectin domain-containing protein [Alterisphingorhabdus coralli]|uniref:H-type lectin domain-containing protein n=1 Tax=Alterisphingorhabdus coralli TaxID=3071408 RepID=A0AA97FBY2_9SPHN|nr:H-type lectin domain-containing protein [Parasphingorhabdus sp. SCSIO 66989]WOE76240.1 H-type lectin domain-containing protein [Parasphingorhabdus sp. SCSIO 66989]